MSLASDTIYALSSGSVPAGIAVVRLSGAGAFAAAELLAGSLPPERQAAVRTLRDHDDRVVDQALVLCFRAPYSFTGEDCVELHLHGSRAVVAAVSRELASIPGLRQAEAGEFSRRAFENGRIDLVEVEGLADLISAETEMQRRLAVEQGFGGQSALYQSWAERLTHARALIEAELDFADEDDVPGSVSDRVWADIAALKAEIDLHLSAAQGGEIIRDGYKVAIVGPPNAGKSSLLNALARRDVAIVTEIAGTTRDVLHVDLDMEGYLVRLFDTAGIRETDDVVEMEGVRRAVRTMDEADLILVLAEIDSAAEPSLPGGKDILRVGSKLDLHQPSSHYDVCLSSTTGDGLEHLRELIVGRLNTLWTASMAPARARQVDLIQATSNSVQDALNGRELDLRAEHLRQAATALGRITGRVDVEQLLDVIFSQFCIGK